MSLLLDSTGLHQSLPCNISGGDKGENGLKCEVPEAYCITMNGQMGAGGD